MLEIFEDKMWYANDQDGFVHVCESIYRLIHNYGFEAKFRGNNVCEIVFIEGVRAINIT